MAGVDLVDESFIVASPQVLAGIITQPAYQRLWWPDLELTVFMDRALLGQRWSVTGALVGSLEIWLEPFADGCIVHHYLRAEPSRDAKTPEPLPDTPAGWRKAAALRSARAKAWKTAVWALKAQLEQGRAAGSPPA